jgi:beta-galactosidase
MVQVENEYGSYGNDHEYMRAIQMHARRRLSTSRFTLRRRGGQDDSEGRHAARRPLAASTSARATKPERPQFANFAKFRTGVPKMVGEFWTGWFDHWGETHHLTNPAKEAANLEWLLAHGIGFNLYMVHGGSSWGPMAGANFSDRYEPDISSYDYDAPIDEAGRLTPKFFALREVIRKHLSPDETLPEPPAPLPVVETPRIQFKAGSPLARLLGAPVRGESPKPMEMLGQAYGHAALPACRGPGREWKARAE